MKPLTYTSEITLAAMEYHTELIGQAPIHGGNQEKWLKSLSDKAVREEVLDFTMDAEEVWKRLNADQQAKLGRDVFVSVLLGSHTRYKPYDRIEVDGKFEDVVEKIVEEFGLNEPAMRA